MKIDIACEPGALPWGFVLGEAVRGQPLVLPTAGGGCWLKLESGGEVEAALGIEAAVLQLLRLMPWRQAQVQVFDFGIRKRFPTLAQLQPLGLYRLFSDAQEAARGLTELERLVRHRHHQLLDDGTPTLADYNRQVPQAEPYQILVIHLDDFPHDAACARQLAAVLREGVASGLFVLAFGAQADESAPAANVAYGHRAPQNLRDVLPEAFLQLIVKAPEQPGAPAGLELLPGSGTEGLAAVLTRHQADLVLTHPPLAPLLAQLREQAAADEAQGTEQDFLQVPVGTTLDGREPVLWSMGGRSGSYNALMLGMPGSGKSTLLNNLIVGIAERYTAQQLHLVLMDYKDGVEFQAFEQHPNVDRIFLDNEDTAAATRLLEEFQATIHERNERFKALRANVRNVDDYNRLQPDAPLPRILLVVDEAQRLLSMSDRRSQRFADLLVDVTRRGRSAGVHIVLSTQSLEGVSDVNRLKVAISLRASFALNGPTDAERVLEPGNSAPLQLKRFEFVLNADSGRKAANVLARGLPTPDVAARLASVRASRSPAACTKAVVVRSEFLAPNASEAVVVRPPAESSQPAPKPAAADTEDVLVRLQRLRGIVPNLPPLAGAGALESPVLNPMPERPL